MRKSIKKIAASLLAATMVLGSFTAVYAADEDATPAPTVLDTIEEGQVLYTIGSAMTTDAWAPESLNNVMKETEWPGVYSLDINVPAATKEVTDETTGETTTQDTGIWEHRFSICAYDYDVESAWNRVILGVPNVKPTDVSSAGANNLTAVRVALTDTARKVTVYFDSKTYAITMKAEDGNPVDYTIGWMTFDDTETYYSPADLSKMTMDEYKAALVEADRAKDLDTYGITTIPDFVKLEADLVAKLAAPPAPAEDPTPAPAEDSTTAAPAADPTTAAPAATTANNQSTKTGDVAPVALMVVLFAAVAVVAVAAKKKEA